METFSALPAVCAGNSPVTGEFPAQRPMTQSFEIFFDLRLNKRLSKQSWGWWFETPPRPLWHHCNVQYKISTDIHNTGTLCQWLAVSLYREGAGVVEIISCICVEGGIEDTWHGNAFQITGPLWGELVTVGFPSKRPSSAELWCFLCR